MQHICADVRAETNVKWRARERTVLARMLVVVAVLIWTGFLVWLTGERHGRRPEP